MVNFTDLYVYDKFAKRIHRIGDEIHDSLYIRDNNGICEVRYYNLQSGDGGGVNNDDRCGYVILQTQSGLFTDEFGIIDERFKNEIEEYLKEVEHD